MESTFICWEGNVVAVYVIFNSCLLYVLSACPIFILGKMAKEYWAFLWGQLAGSKGLHLISWDQVCSPKQEGDLGLTSLRNHKQALFCKLTAQLILKFYSLWARIVSAKYKFLGLWNGYKKPFKCATIWSKIRANGQQIQFQFIWFIGSSISIDVMYDPWMATTPLNAWPTYINMDVSCTSIKVKDLLLPSQVWKSTMLTSMFSKDLVKEICTIPIAEGL